MSGPRDWFMWAGVCLLFLGMLYGIFALTRSEIREFRNSGFPAEATITGKRDRLERNSQGDRRTVYYFDVTFFDKSDPDETQTVDVGVFKTGTAEVRRQDYNQYEVDDTVEILFLLDDPTQIELASYINGWSGLSIYFCMAPFALAFIVLLLGGVFFWIRSLSELN
ncbi:MAG: DUF3592 domain-containing protein [Chloroflexota bacterium]